MRKDYVFTFEVEPVSKGRPRFTRGGHTYTPAPTAKFEKTIGTLAMSYIQNVYPELVSGILDGPIMMIIQMEFKKPKKPANPYPRQDIDNCAKSIMDALNQIVYQDDKQVISLICEKRYGPKSNIRVVVTSLEHQDPQVVA